MIEIGPNLANLIGNALGGAAVVFIFFAIHLDFVEGMTP